MIRIALVEDDPEQREVIATLFHRHSIQCELFGGSEQALPSLSDPSLAAVVCDIRLGGGMSGLALCARVKEINPDLPVILITGSSQLEVAIEAIRAGAYDFIPKPIAPETLLASVRRAAERHELREEIRRLKHEVEVARPIHGLLGDSAALREVMALVRRVADTDATILIEGESGTGKELVSRSVHELSSRHAKPLVAINCAALPPALLESELFGHVRGAFTDAKKDHEGLFVQAQGGTVLGFPRKSGQLFMQLSGPRMQALAAQVIDNCWWNVIE